MPTPNTYTPPLQINIIEILVSLAQGRLTGANGTKSLFEMVAGWWYVFSIVAFLVSAILLVATVYAMIRFSELRKIENEALREAERAFRQTHAAVGENTKWQRILAHTSSDSPSDWRLAIIEADIMLDELLDSLGYSGSSTGEKLKTARPEAFRSIEDAWNAHKVRNAIAHQGSDFVLTKRATNEAITQYQHVFEEFKFL
jgi:uncharacterized membrane protein